MASDELVLRLKIDVEGGGAKIQDAQKQMETIKKSAKEAGTEAQKNQGFFGSMWSKFTGGAKEAVGGMRLLDTVMKASAIGLLIGLVTALYNRFKQTKEGADQIAKVMKVVGQFIIDGPVVAFKALKVALDFILLPFKTLFSVVSNMIAVIKGDKGLGDAIRDVSDSFKNNTKKMVEDIKEVGKATVGMVQNMKDAAKQAERLDELEERKRANLVKNKQLEAELQNLREKAADTDEKLIDRITALNQANVIAGEQYKMLKQDKLDEIAAQKEELRLFPDKEEAIIKISELTGELADIETGYAKDKKMIGKQLNTLEKQQVKDAEDKVKAIQKAEQEIVDIKNQTLLASLEGQQKEQEAIDQKYEKEYALAEGNAEKQKALNELRIAESLALQKKYDKEKQKIDKEAQDKLDKQREDDLKKQEEADQKALESYNRVLATKRDMEAQNNQEKLDNGEINIQEYLDMQEELEMQAAEIQITNTDELEAKKEEIRNAYRIKRVAAEKDVDNMIKDGAIQVAQAASDAVFSVLQNRLNQQKNAELLNKNLTEAQKDAINKKYADKQKKMDIAMALVNVAMSIIKVFSSMGPPASFIMAAITAILGGIQVATIAKTKYYARGGWLEGASHANGGVPLGNGNMAEGGEYIVNKASMANPQMAQEVMKINQAGNTGNMKPSPPPITVSDIIAGVAGAIKAIPVVVTENQITLAQNNVKVREDRFSVV